MVQCNSVPHMPHKMHMFDNEKSITPKPVRVAGRQGGYVPPKTAAYIWNATPPVLQEGFIPPITYDKSEPCNAIPPDPNICFKINRSYLINSTSIWYSSRYHTHLRTCSTIIINFPTEIFTRYAKNQNLIVKKRLQNPCDIVAMKYFCFWRRKQLEV